MGKDELTRELISDTPGQCCLLPQLSIVEVNAEVEVRRLHPLKSKTAAKGSFFVHQVSTNENPEP